MTWWQLALASWPLAAALLALLISRTIAIRDQRERPLAPERIDGATTPRTTHPIRKARP